MATGRLSRCAVFKDVQKKKNTFTSRVHGTNTVGGSNANAVPSPVTSTTIKKNKITCRHPSAYGLFPRSKTGLNVSNKLLIIVGY